MDRSSSVCAATEPGVASSLGGNAPQVIDDSTLPASFSGMAPGAGSATVSSALATELGPAEGTTSTEAATEDGGQDEPMTCLPPSTIPTKELIALVQRAMTERNVTQNRLCGKLCLSPVYFSMWLREKQLPRIKTEKYAAALELWLPRIKAEKYAAAAELWVNDASFTIQDPRLTDTNRAQVPTFSRSSEVVSRGRGRPPGNGRGGRPARAANASDGSGTSAGVKRERPGQWAQPTTVHGITCEMLAGLPEVSFQLVPPRRPRSRVVRPATFIGTEVDTTFCIVTASFVGDRSAGGGGEGGIERRPIEVRMETESLGWLHLDGILRPPGEREAGVPYGVSAGYAQGEGAGGGGAGENGGGGASNGGEGGEEGGGGEGNGMEGSGCGMQEGGLVPGSGVAGSAMLPYACAPSMPLPPGEDDCLANNKPQRKRKAINYVEMDDHSQGAAITSPQGQRHRAGEGMGDEADGDGDMYGADSTDTAMVSAAATDSESAIESTGGDAESQRAQLRRRVQCTLERMAATPLELRRKLKHAESISQRSPYQLFWRAFCSTCGMRFERVEGPLQLASHCGWHHMKDLLEYRRAHEVQPLLEAIRTTGSPPELQRHIQAARTLMTTLADASLHKAVLEAEQRIARMVENKRARQASGIPEPVNAVLPAAPYAGRAGSAGGIRSDTVCTAFLQGRCHKGRACKWEHPGKERGAPKPRAPPTARIVMPDVPSALLPPQPHAEAPELQPHAVPQPQSQSQGSLQPQPLAEPQAAPPAQWATQALPHPHAAPQPLPQAAPPSQPQPQPLPREAPHPSEWATQPLPHPQATSQARSLAASHSQFQPVAAPHPLQWATQSQVAPPSQTHPQPHAAPQTQARPQPPAISDAPGACPAPSIAFGACPAPTRGATGSASNLDASGARGHSLPGCYIPPGMHMPPQPAGNDYAPPSSSSPAGGAGSARVGAARSPALEMLREDIED